VAVFGVAHPRRIETVIAMVVPKPGASPTEGSGDQAHAGLLAGHWTPQRVVIADAIPAHGPMLAMRMQHPAHHSPATSPEMPDLRTAKCFD